MILPTITSRLAPLALVALLAVNSRAEPPPISPSSLLEHLDEGVADRGPSSLSLRRLDIDLRQDSSFEHVYAVPGRPDLFMRRQGAVSAVFPESRYLASAQGDIAVIPAGTIFYIGLPTLFILPSPTSHTADHHAPSSLMLSRPPSTPISAPIDARIARPITAPTAAPTPRPTTSPSHTMRAADLSQQAIRARRLRQISDRLAPPAPPTPPTTAPQRSPPSDIP